MDAARIADLLAPFLAGDTLTAAQLDQLARYLDLLLRWNARINLTAVRDPEQIVTRHFGESLFAARTLLPPPAGLQVHDFGSGAGFPGLPIKIWAPAARVTLIESQNKKQAFLGEAIRLLALSGVDIFPGRAEDLTTTAHLVTLRAVEKFERALPLAARLVSPGGRLALLIGARQEPLARNLASHLQWSKAVPVPLSDARILLVGRNPGGDVSDQ